MAHSYVSCLVHCVFAVKERRSAIPEPVRPRLHEYIGGIARTNGIKALAVGGTGDHAHVLLSVPGAMPIAKAMQLIKAGSSKWIHETLPDLELFQWQEGYGAFSVGISQVEDTVDYILHQDAHHRSRTARDEFEAFLRRHGLADGAPPPGN